MAKTSFNYNKAATALGKGALVVGLGCSPLWAMGLGVYLMETEDSAQQKLVDEIPVETTVMGPGQITVTRGTLKYIFDFESGVVFIDTGTRQTDMELREFDNQNLIKQVKTQGCDTPEGQPRLAAFICQ
jgi:hypothetical protein